jgi:hypothetical protein
MDNHNCSFYLYELNKEKLDRLCTPSYHHRKTKLLSPWSKDSAPKTGQKSAKEWHRNTASIIALANNADKGNTVNTQMAQSLGPQYQQTSVECKRGKTYVRSPPAVRQQVD